MRSCAKSVSLLLREIGGNRRCMQIPFRSCATIENSVSRNNKPRDASWQKESKNKSKARKTGSKVEQKTETPKDPVTIAEEKRNVIRNTIRTSYMFKIPDTLLQSYDDAVRNNISLEMSDKQMIMWALCTTKPAKANEAKFFTLYDDMKLKNALNTEACRYALSCCRIYKNAPRAIMVVDDYMQRFAWTDSMYWDALSAITACELRHAVKQHYSIYHSLRAEHGWRPLPLDLYYDIAKYLCVVGETALCLSILRDSKAFTNSVDLVLCRSLLDNALLAGQQLIVAHILNWHVEASDDSPRILPGVLSQCIAMLATYAEEKVVLDAFALRRKYGMRPLAMDYANLFKAACKAGRVESVLEALLMAQEDGIDFSSEFDSISDTHVSSDICRHLENCFSRILGSIAAHDTMYFALVDLTQSSNKPPPILALNSLLAATGNLGALDRTFGTFNEFESVFHVKPTAASYTYLIIALARSKQPNVSMMMSLLQGLDAHGIPPVANMYNVLLMTMAETNEMHGVWDILQHMMTLKLVPSPLAMRRIALYFAHTNNVDDLQRIHKVLTDITGRPVPSFHKKRIDFILQTNQKTDEENE